MTFFSFLTYYFIYYTNLLTSGCKEYLGSIARDKPLCHLQTEKEDDLFLLGGVSVDATSIFIFLLLSRSRILKKLGNHVKTHTYKFRYFYLSHHTLTFF